MTREELKSVLQQGLAEIEAGSAGELAAAHNEVKRWKDEWQSLMEYVSNIRESRIWADQAYFKAKQEASDLAKRAEELEREKWVEETSGVENRKDLWFFYLQAKRELAELR